MFESRRRRAGLVFQNLAFSGWVSHNTHALYLEISCRNDVTNLWLSFSIPTKKCVKAQTDPYSQFIYPGLAPDLYYWVNLFICMGYQFKSEKDYEQEFGFKSSKLWCNCWLAPYLFDKWRLNQDQFSNLFEIKKNVWDTPSEIISFHCIAQSLEQALGGFYALCSDNVIHSLIT